jgi:SAM-dependent methyltransferase
MSYTHEDHLFRDQDQYANGKYELTMRWLKQAGLKEPMVNIGCGAGDFNRIAANAGFVVSAYEPDAKVVEVALKNAPPLVKVQKGTLADAALAEKGAKLVVMHDVLEHIENDREAIQQLSEMLSPGGYLFLSVPACSWLFGKHDEELFHFRRYSKSSLLRLLEKDFEVVRVRWYGFLFIPITLFFSVLARKSYPKPNGKRGLAYLVIRSFIAIEKRIAFPLGTALMVLARRR